MERSTWSELRAPSLSALPSGCEPLRTVGECHLVYSSTVEGRGDPDLALAAFYRRHVDAAMRGHAWLVARDRGQGLVMVLGGSAGGGGARKQIIARTDEILAPPQHRCSLSRHRAEHTSSRVVSASLVRVKQNVATKESDGCERDEAAP